MEISESTHDWKKQKAKLRLKFATLMNDNQMLDEDKKEEVIKKLQTRLGKTKEELLRIIAEL
jgi:hypothetical protein